MDGIIEPNLSQLSNHHRQVISAHAEGQGCRLKAAYIVRRSDEAARQVIAAAKREEGQAGESEETALGDLR
jgi:hypothetical protein